MANDSTYLEVFTNLIQFLKSSNNFQALDLNSRGSIKDKFIELSFQNEIYEGSVLVNDEAVQMLTLEVSDKLNGEHYIWTDAMHKYTIEQEKEIIQKLFASVKSADVKDFFQILQSKI